MVAINDTDAEGPATENVVTQPPYPWWLATILVTADSVATDDGTLLNGVFLLTPSAPLYVPGWGVFEDSASLNVVNGVGTAVRVPCTNALTVTFTYSIETRLDGPDISPSPVTGVTIPMSDRPSIDISSLL